MPTLLSRLVFNAHKIFPGHLNKVYRQYSVSLLQGPRARAGKSAKSSLYFNLCYSLPFSIYIFFHRIPLSISMFFYRFPLSIYMMFTTSFFDFHVICSKLTTSPHESYMSFAGFMVKCIYLLMS